MDNTFPEQFRRFVVRCGHKGINLKAFRLDLQKVRELGNYFSMCWLPATGQLCLFNVLLCKPDGTPWNL